MTQTAPIQPLLKDVIRPTTFIENERLSERLGAHLTIASETFQVTGSFKFRAAYNLAANVPETEIIAASSGNFGQAMAWACTLLGKKATIVMPETSAKVKVASVLEYGGRVELIDTRVMQRADKVRQLAAANPKARVASSYDEDLVIAGNASLGEEIAARDQFDFVVVPVGGGGLIAGVARGLAAAENTSTQVIGAEPLLANDAARSLRLGELVRMEVEPETIADGARTLCLGTRNWEIIRHSVKQIFELDDAGIADGVRTLFTLANLKAEPTGALTIAAVALNRQFFAGKKVCCVVSGGNVDPGAYAEILAG